MSILDTLTPYKLVAEVVVIGGLGLGAAWGFHALCDHQREIGRQEVRAEDARLELVRTTAQAKLDAELNQRVTNAESRATDRETLQKTLDAAVGVSADRLRSTLNQVRAGSDTATVETLRATTATLATVFQDCTTRYRALGQAADGHASDVQTLSDAWPVAPPASSQQNQ